MVESVKGKGNFYATFIIEIFYLAYFLRMIVGANTSVGLVLYGVMSSIGILSVFFIIFFRKVEMKLKIISLMLVLILFGFIASIYTHNYRVQDFIIILQYFGVALILLRYTLNYVVVRSFYIFYVIYFGINLIIGTHPDNLFEGFSRNNILVLLIMHCIILYISLYQNKMKISIYPAFIPIIFSFWAMGRSGIFVSILLFLFVLLYNQILSTKRIFKLILMLSVSLLLFYLLTLFFYDEILKGAIDRISSLGILDEHRGKIINEYFYNITHSIGSFLWGVPIKNNPIFNIYGNNLHNSYLRLHAYHGFFGVMTVIIFILRASIIYLRKKEFLYLGLLFILLVRMSTDIVAFHGPYDPLVYFFALNSSTLKRRK